MIPQSEIGRRLLDGLTLAGAAAAGIPEARAAVAAVAEAEYEAVRDAKMKELYDALGQSCQLADEFVSAIAKFGHAIAIACSALEDAARLSRVPEPRGYLRCPPGTRANRRHRRRS